MQTTLPSFFYPTRKMLLDDDLAYAQSVSLQMHGKRFFEVNSVADAIHYFTEKNNPDKNARDDISILFVDYHMPGMNGIEVLKKMAGVPVKKVLMTGERDYDLIIDAFNHGLMDAYIRKNEPDFLTKIQQTTADLEWKYFTDFARTTGDITDPDFLKNTHVTKQFLEFMSQKNIRDFHLTDREGTFLTRNSQGEKEYFILRNRTQLQQLAEFAAEDGASEKTVNLLKEGKAIPFFYQREHWEVPGNEWEAHLYPATVVAGDEEFLWVVVR
ncbi:MAG TPA: response regulator [Gammaproteobacteria bacterium]|nr:response regulator [Gammaproteobacteria bacterium]